MVEDTVSSTNMPPPTPLPATSAISFVHSSLILYPSMLEGSFSAASRFDGSRAWGSAGADISHFFEQMHACPQCHQYRMQFISQAEGKRDIS